MNLPHDKMSRIALIVVGVIFLSHAVYLSLQLFLGTRTIFFQPSIISAIFTGLLSIVSLFLFFAWQEHFRFLLLALFFFWLSFSVKDIAGFLVVDRRIVFEILVTAFRIIMCVSLAVGILQGELNRLLTRRWSA